LVLLVLLPLIASVALATARVVTESNAIGTESDLSGQVQVGQSVSRLVHALQDERDLIALYLTGGQKASDMSTLATAESGTANQVQSFEGALQQYSGAVNALSASAQALALQAQARLGDLPVLRSSVVSLGDSRPVFQAYTNVINNLLNFSQQLATGTTDHTLGNLVSTLSLVQQTGEQTSQERGFLVVILGNGGQIREQQEDLIQAQATYTSAFAAFTAQATAQSVNLFESTVGGQDTGNTDSVVQQLIDAALEQRPVSSVGVASTAAFTAAGTKISQIRGVEAQLGAQALDRTSALLSAARTQLSLNVAIVLFTLLLAFLATAVVARSIVGPLRVLRTSAYQIATISLPEVIRRLRDASDVDTEAAVEPIAVRSRDEIGEVARAFDEVHVAAVRLASEQALLRNNVNAIFKNLSRRSQGLVERQLRLIDGLENSERDPGQLAQLFKLDHLATRMRRNNENLLVLAGEETARRWTEAVRLVDVARAAAAEVEQYERIMFGAIPRTRIIGKAAPDVAHLVAELLENATTYSAPQTKVWVAARSAQDGGVILHIEDVGIGMTTADIQKANEHLARPPVVGVGVSRQMGLFVVGRLAARYSIKVQLSESQAGGITASIHLPVSLIDISRMMGERSGPPEVDGYAIPPELTRGARRDPAEHGWDTDPADPRRRGETAVPHWQAPDEIPHQPGLNGASRPQPGSRNGSQPGAQFPGPRPGRQADQISWWDQPVRGKAAQQPDPQPPQPDPELYQAQRQPPQPSAAPQAQGPDTNERLPIFEAVESEWFLRRGKRAPHAGWSPRAAQPWESWSSSGESATTNGAGNATAAGPGQQPEPARYAAPSIVEPPMPTPSWSSTGDDGWRAAEALARPNLDGITPTGLPKRVPKANLVPGKAGGSGAARATPPPGLTTTAEAVRKRLSTFRRHSQPGSGEPADQS
jgi:signal transduction histidine kinase/flagellar hook-basal body complex protein FliE